MQHELKTWPIYFNRVWSGEKTFEVRKMDRDFIAYDTLLLKEWDNDTGEYTGRTISAVVTYLLKGGQFGIEEGYCVMALQLITKKEN